jgi:hypothetical protein
MKFGFKDWRECSQDLIPITLDKSRLYYMQARAWNFKGYIGGTHSWTTFFSKEHNAWLVVEYTERETLSFQDGRTIYDGNVTIDDTKHAPYIASRSYNAQWFGADPYIVDSCLSVTYSEMLKACTEFPYTEFDILHLNCNTFTSYLHWKLGLPLKRPLRSVGYKNKDWWESRHGKLRK